MKKVLFHCGSGNHIMPERWGSIHTLFKGLASSLQELGFQTVFYIHPKAYRGTPDPQSEYFIREDVDPSELKKINPHKFFTWNGSSSGDLKVIETLGKDKMVVGELGFFDHYNKTCYFDNGGTNLRYSLIGTKYSNDPLTSQEKASIDALKKENQKPRLERDPFIFIPLQDEMDTQVTVHSPYRKMDEVLDVAESIFKNYDSKILYKKHPRSIKETVIKPREGFIEVTEDVHNYLPYADFVFGLNSTVLVETLIYHSRVISYGAGVSSRGFETNEQRSRFILDLKDKQFKWDDLSKPHLIGSSYLIEYLT